MDSRERVIRAIELSGPDRPPVMHRTLPGAFRQHGAALEALYARYPGDVLLSPTLRAPFKFREPAGEGAEAGRIVDSWGCAWNKLTDDYAGQVVGHPLEDWSALESYRWPDPGAGSEGADELVWAVRADGRRHYAMAAAGTIYHRYCFLRGMENGLIDAHEGSEPFQYLLGKIADFVVERARLWAQIPEVDGVLIEDDWGSQQNLLIHPHDWRRWFAPAYRRIVEAIHAGGKRAHLHSDGQISAIIPDLIDMGWDEINPQVWVMDLEELGRQWAGRVCFRADLDRQWTLPFGTPADVADHVRRTAAALSRPAGGYIGYGQIGPDVPLENAEAMLQTLCELT
jgi:uroporphyrinogen decarboxylase